MTNYQFPRLVRVLWTPQNSRKRKTLAAVRLARHENEAFEIANAVEFAMVPLAAKRIVYQIAIIDRRPTTRDASAEDTQWQTFFPEIVRGR